MGPPPKRHKSSHTHADSPPTQQPQPHFSTSTELESQTPSPSTPSTQTQPWMSAPEKEKDSTMWPTTIAHADAVQRTVTSANGFQPLSREAQVGILYYVSANDVGFTGVLKQRYVLLDISFPSLVCFTFPFATAPVLLFTLYCTFPLFFSSASSLGPQTLRHASLQFCGRVAPSAFGFLLCTIYVDSHHGHLPCFLPFYFLSSTQHSL